MLNHDHGSTDTSHLACNGVNSFDHALRLEGSVFPGAKGLLDINDEERSVHEFEGLTFELGLVLDLGIPDKE